MDTCEEFYQSTHPNRTAGQWDILNSTPGSAVPLAETSLGVAAADVPYSATGLGSVGKQVGAAEQNKMHETGTANRWKEFYTQEVGDLVYAMYRPDFKTFGYPYEIFST